MNPLSNKSDIEYTLYNFQNTHVNQNNCWTCIRTVMKRGSADKIKCWKRSL